MAMLTVLTDDRAEVLVQYIHSAKAGKPVHPSGFSKDAKKALRQQVEAFEERDGVLFNKLVDSTSGTTSLQRVLVTQEKKSSGGLSQQDQWMSLWPRQTFEQGKTV